MDMTSHNATGQMTGYLYQVRLALKLLLESDDPLFQISLEKFDDIAFDKDDEPVQLIQAKHHSKPASLSDSSVDLWRTLNEWFDVIEKDNTILDHTDFIIITTASVPVDSIATSIIAGNYQRAYNSLKDVAESKGNQANVSYYQHFLNMPARIVLKILRRIQIISSANSIKDISRDIEKQIRYACRPEHVLLAISRIEGWWFQECIKALTSESLVITTQSQLHAKILEITRQYGEDNLPIEFWDLEGVEEDELDSKERMFLDQLRLLQCKSNTLRLAIRDYYRASKQRSNWLRQGLVYANELDIYEHRLKDSWEHAFFDMEEELSDYNTPTEAEKIKAGKALYRKMMEQDIRIRKGVEAAYVMKGTYHHLANRLVVGWHIDFLEKLKSLLDGD